MRPLHGRVNLLPDGLKPDELRQDEWQPDEWRPEETLDVGPVVV